MRPSLGLVIFMCAAAVTVFILPQQHVQAGTQSQPSAGPNCQGVHLLLTRTSSALSNRLSRVDHGLTVPRFPVPIDAPLYPRAAPTHGRYDRGTFGYQPDSPFLKAASANFTVSATLESVSYWMEQMLRLCGFVPQTQADSQSRYFTIRAFAAPATSSTYLSIRIERMHRTTRLSYYGVAVSPPERPSRLRLPPRVQSVTIWIRPASLSFRSVRFTEKRAAVLSTIIAAVNMPRTIAPYPELGCPFRHLRYEPQAELQAKLLNGAITRIMVPCGGDFTIARVGFYDGGGLLSQLQLVATLECALHRCHRARSHPQA